MSDPIRPTDVERPFVTGTTGVVRPPQKERAVVDRYSASPSPPAPSSQTHWLQAGELQRRIAVVKSLFATEQVRAFLLATTGVTLERLITSLQESPLRFFEIMHAYFAETAGRFANADDATIKVIREEPMSNGALTKLAIFSGNMVVVIAKNDWLFQGLALADPQFAKRHEDARTNLLKIDNQKFLDALRRGFNEIDRWFLALRALGDTRWNVLKYLGTGLSDTARALDYIRTVLDNSARIFSPMAASEQSVAYWELRAIGHYLSNKIQLLVGYYELTRTYPSNVADYISKIIKHMRAYVSITETNPFKFLPEVINGLGGWTLMSDAEQFLTEGVPIWLYPIIENMIQNAMRDHLKKEGDFEGVIGMMSGDGLPLSTPQRVKEEPSRWRVVFIKDNGNGIPDDIKEKVFKERVHADTSAPGNGEGLLYSFQLLTRRGGHIWFDTVQGVGTTFYVALPAGPDADGGGDGGGGSPVTGGGGKAFAPIGGYDGDTGANALSAGARAALQAGQATGDGAYTGGQVPFAGAARVFTPVTVTVTP